MEIATFGSIGLTVALASFAVEIIKKLIMEKVFPPKKNGLSKEEKSLLFNIRDSLIEISRIVHGIPTESPTLTPSEHKALFDLMEMHDNRDQDGIPLWWMPRSWHKTLEESLKVSTEIAYNQKDLAKAMDHIVSALERLADKGRRDQR